MAVITPFMELFPVWRACLAFNGCTGQGFNQKLMILLTPGVIKQFDQAAPARMMRYLQGAWVAIQRG